jgi:hypothetical protein
LTIEAGARVYSHAWSGLVVYKEATLIVNGALDNEVTFEGDRLEEDYDDLPGQWGHPLFGGIWLYPTSINNEINYAVIRNGYIGIQADTVGNSSNPTLELNNTIIENMAHAGILAQGSFIESTNCVIANCGLYNALLQIGGEYDFRHCTFANYWSSGYPRETAALVLNNYYEDVNGVIQARPLTKAYFGNCIIYGSLESEIILDQNNSADFTYTFDHCLIKVNNDINTSTAEFIDIIKNKDPEFVDAEGNDYQLNSVSNALNEGNLTIASFVPTDILGTDRINTDGQPDLGAYERTQ